MSFDQGFGAKAILAFDVFFCALFFRDPSVTISAETGLALLEPVPPLWARVLGRILTYQHCSNAIAHDIARARAAILYLTSPSVPDPFG